MLNALIKARCCALQAVAIGTLTQGYYYGEYMLYLQRDLGYYHESLTLAVPEDLDLSTTLTVSTDLAAIEKELLSNLLTFAVELEDAAREYFKTDLCKFAQLCDCLKMCKDLYSRVYIKLKERDFEPAPLAVN